MVIMTALHMTWLASFDSTIMDPMFAFGFPHEGHARFCADYDALRILWFSSFVLKTSGHTPQERMRDVNRKVLVWN